MKPWEQCESDEQAVIRELFWMDHFDSTSRNKGFNLRRDSQRGMITHAETSAKIRANLLRQWRSGERSMHSEKLKARWANDPERCQEQGISFKKNLTKYWYVLSRSDEDLEIWCEYKELHNRGLGSALSSFMRSRSNVVELKGHTIRRVPVCPV